MEYFIITGTGKGLGKALAKNVLEKGAVVFGITRTHTIQHQNYKALTFDLSNPDFIDNLSITIPKDADRIVLINNAGIVGEINHVGNINPASFTTLFNVNVTAVALLTNWFIKAFESYNCNKLIANISSGAGKTPIDGWAAYCASKAAVDMFSKVVHEEFVIDQRNDFKILSIAPGIIDTNMQSEIRSADKKGFSNLERFESYKAEGELATPESTAEKVLKFINYPSLATDIICSVRTLE